MRQILRAEKENPGPVQRRGRPARRGRPKSLMPIIAPSSGESIYAPRGATAAGKDKESRAWGSSGEGLEEGNTALIHIGRGLGPADDRRFGAHHEDFDAAVLVPVRGGVVFREGLVLAISGHTKLVVAHTTMP